VHKKIELIQVIRGIAALLVCSFHMKTLLNTPAFAYGNFFFGSGAIGVPFFFILSGFIIFYTTQNTARSVTSVRVFALKRVFRIVPLYYLITLIWIVGLGQVGYYLTRRPDLLLSALTFVPSFTSTVGPSFGFPPVAIGWTLAYEMLFYLIFCISLFFGKLRYAVLSFIIVSVVVGLPFLIGASVSFDASYAYGFNFRYLEVMASPVMLYFLLGVLLGWIYQSPFTIKSPTITFLMVGVSLVYFWLAYFGIGHLSNNIFANMLSCGALLFSLLMWHKNRPIFFFKPLVYLGDISYSVYLVHPLVIVFLPKILRSVGFASLSKGPALFVLAIIVILIISIISYEFLERKMLSRISRAIV